MDSLDLIRTFREVAQRSSFAAAARALDLAPASVSKYVAALEARFGVRLFNRTTRKVTLTDAGHLLFEHTGPLLDIVALAQDELLERASRPSGKLTLSAPYALMQTSAPALIGRFLSRYPDVSLQLLVTNRLIDLADSGEIILAPQIAPAPLVQPWFAGIANVRGNLFAVSDFSAFLGTQPTPHNANARLLLIGVRHGSNAALLVPRMLGLKKPENFVPQADDENFPDWGKQRFSDSEDRLWRKLAVRELLADRTFMNIGI